MFASRIQGTKITCQRLTLALAVLCAGIVALAPAQAAAAGTSSDYIVLMKAAPDLPRRWLARKLAATTSKMSSAAP